MSATDGPTVQEVERLNAINRGDVQDPMSGSWGPAGQSQAVPDTSGQRDAIAQALMAQGGGGNPWAAYTAPRAQQASGDPYASLRASMASRASQPQADPYASLRASMASRAQPAAAAGGGGFGTNPSTGKPWANGYEELAWYQQQQDADPNAQYFAAKGPMSGSVTDSGWMNALQPWQGGSIGGQPGSGVNTSGFIGGGGAIHADPAYWGSSGPGAQRLAADQWQWLQMYDPLQFERLGGFGAAAAGAAAGIGPGGDAGAGPGSSGGGGGGGGVGGGGVGGGGVGGGGNTGNTGNSAALGGGFAGGGIGSDAHYGNQLSGLNDSMAAANAANTAATAAAFANSYGAQMGALGENVASDLGALGEGWGGEGAAPY